MCPWLPKPIIFDFGDTRIHKTNQGKTRSFCKSIMLGNRQKLLRACWFVLEKTGAGNPDNQHNTAFENLEYGKLQENMNWAFSKFLVIWNMRSISIRNHEMEFWILETLKFRNFENWHFRTLRCWDFYTLKLWNVETLKLRTSETLKLWIFEFKNLWNLWKILRGTRLATFRLPPLHQHPSW